MGHNVDGNARKRQVLSLPAGFAIVEWEWRIQYLGMLPSGFKRHRVTCCVAPYDLSFHLYNRAVANMYIRSALLSLSALAAAKEMPKDEIKAAELYDSGIRHANNIALKKVRAPLGI